MMEIRPATPEDLAAMPALRRYIAEETPRHRAFIKHVLPMDDMYLALIDGEFAGSVITDDHLWGRGFVWLLWVEAGFRWQGLATALMRHAEKLASPPRLFTSTSHSNLAAQRLFEELGYERSGELRWIDDPGLDLYYSKAVKPRGEL
jgi:ribosomal protein S18 acetylase RimI-like enzyme